MPDKKTTLSSIRFVLVPKSGTSLIRLPHTSAAARPILMRDMAFMRPAHSRNKRRDWSVHEESLAPILEMSFLESASIRNTLKIARERSNNEAEKVLFTSPILFGGPPVSNPAAVVVRPGRDPFRLAKHLVSGVCGRYIGFDRTQQAVSGEPNLHRVSSSAESGSCRPRNQPLHRPAAVPRLGRSESGRPRKFDSTSPLLQAQRNY